MLRYHFGISVIEMPGSNHRLRKKIFSVSIPYEMLSYLSDGCPAEYTREIIENLEKVISKQEAEYGIWGHELAYIMSYHEKSEVSYTHTDKNGKVVESQIEIPTSWLLKLMKDWLEFLDREEDGTETAVYGVTVP